MKIDVDKLSPRELDALLTAAQQRQTLLHTRRPAALVRRELIELAASHGYGIQELLDVEASSGAAKHRKRRSRVQTAAKYRDPGNKRHTWSGRGRMPRWLADKVKRGQSIADFSSRASPGPPRSRAAASANVRWSRLRVPYGLIPSTGPN